MHHPYAGVTCPFLTPDPNILPDELICLAWWWWEEREYKVSAAPLQKDHEEQIANGFGGTCNCHCLLACVRSSLFSVFIFCSLIFSFLFELKCIPLHRTTMQIHLRYIRKRIKCQQTENRKNHYKEGGIKTYLPIISLKSYLSYLLN